MEYRLDYEPGESRRASSAATPTGAGPIWFPINYLILESLQRYHQYFGDDFKVECPDGLGKDDDASRGLPRARAAALDDLPARRRTARGPCSAGIEIFRNDPHWKDLVLFHEYFHGDTGKGLGASHQTGWTGLIAKLLAEKSGRLLQFTVSEP